MSASLGLMSLQNKVTLENVFFPIFNSTSRIIWFHSKNLKCLMLVKVELLNTYKLIDKVMISFQISCFRNPSDFTTLATTTILPVDLNTFILKVWLRTLLDRIIEIRNQLACAVVLC